MDTSSEVKYRGEDNSLIILSSVVMVIWFYRYIL